MLFDEDRVRRLAGEIRRAVARLKELGEIPKTEFLADPHRVASAKYHFIVGIEAAVDLGNHIISKNSLGTPDDYGHIFRILGEAGVVPQEFATELANMARFRNRLVHIYWEVDEAEVYRLLSAGVTDLEKFLSLLRESLGNTRFE
ncbi:TPA: DUF86 domain-containing protein [Candidatus Acetothermia bacterium]|nr:DUF86 domain-containing protein [Candidatus Acetothermia bacterium]HAZ30627.1 DUF86 domain-containing protein [Candidatus Acetothermia bacterium]